MKAFKMVLMVALAGVLLTYSSCSKKHNNPEPVTDQQLDKLVKTWKVSTTSPSVTLDGVDKSAAYSGFTLTIAGTKGTTSYTYTTSGRPDFSAWKSSGTWVYGSDPVTMITRDPDNSSDAVNITYAVTATTLQLTFQYSGTGYSNTSRTSQVAGQWVFNLIPQ